jgi:hypothetical protein
MKKIDDAFFEYLRKTQNPSNKLCIYHIIERINGIRQYKRIFDLGSFPEEFKYYEIQEHTKVPTCYVE